MSGLIDDYNAYRQRMNDKILASGDKTIKRIYNADTNAFLAGALDVKTKEIMGLVASMVLRCDDCIRYHLLKCHENGLTTEELFEVFGIANLVGGTIVIPHTRRALEFWEEILYSDNKE
ncbi:MAG: carboxymuconolactone decarboxylase family protein [Bacteroidetes bacterium]|nr:carboxymuconolactone decarboxylase family protein [Bacteroidota bacterium]